jgi:hypothetical protein
MSDDNVTSIQSVSPSRKQRPERDEMNFAQAIAAVAGGAKVTKDEWGEDGIYLVMHDEKVYIMNGIADDGKLHPFIISLGDMQGTDYRRLV